jgi:hypothetical protein
MATRDNKTRPKDQLEDREEQREAHEVEIPLPAFFAHLATSRPPSSIRPWRT